MELGYSNRNVYGENLISELKEIEKTGVVFRNYHQTVGTEFTIGGIAAQLTGIPLTRYPLDIHKFEGASSFDTLLKNNQSIFNLLKNDSYRTAAFTGASRKFTQKEAFFKSHGITEVYSKEYFMEHGYPLNEDNAGTIWGYNDEFLWTRFKEYLIGTSNKEQPFAVVFETVDTHLPDGFAKSKFRIHNDMRDAVRASSIMTKDFLEWAKKQPWYDNTVILIVGDHLWQMPEKSAFTNFVKKSANRQIYNVFLNAHNVRKGVVHVDGGWSSHDMAPTILDAMGIDYHATTESGNVVKNRVGLGISLLSNKKTLVSEYGIQHVNNELGRPSSFYNRLF